MSFFVRLRRTQNLTLETLRFAQDDYQENPPSRFKVMGIRWPLAKVASGTYVRVQDATREEPYYCPECSAPFVARQGQIKRWHFAHYPGVVCTGEGSRHSIAKHYTTSFLACPITLPLHCQCGLSTKGFKVTVHDVVLEASVLDYRVDVVCKRNGQLICMEVVDAHPTEPEKVKALASALTEVNISDLSDDEIFTGERVHERLLAALSDHLLQGLTQPFAFFHTWRQPCWRCSQEISVIVLCQEGMWLDTIPAPLLAEMRKYAKMEWRTTSIVREGYVANVCPFCEAVQGDWHVFRDLIERRESGERVETIFWISQVK